MAGGDAEFVAMSCKKQAIGSWLSVRTRIVRKLAEAGGIVSCNRLSRHTTIGLWHLQEVSAGLPKRTRPGIASRPRGVTDYSIRI